MANYLDLIIALGSMYAQRQRDKENNKPPTFQQAPLTEQEQWLFDRQKELYGYSPTRDYISSYGDSFIKSVNAPGGVGDASPNYASPFMKGSQLPPMPKVNMGPGGGMPQGTPYWKPDYKRPGTTESSADNKGRMGTMSPRGFSTAGRGANWQGGRIQDDPMGLNDPGHYWDPADINGVRGRNQFGLPTTPDDSRDAGDTSIDPSTGTRWGTPGTDYKQFSWEDAQKLIKSRQATMDKYGRLISTVTGAIIGYITGGPIGAVTGGIGGFIDGRKPKGGK